MSLIANWVKLLGDVAKGELHAFRVNDIRGTVLTLNRTSSVFNYDSSQTLESRGDV